MDRREEKLQQLAASAMCERFRHRNITVEYSNKDGDCENCEAESYCCNSRKKNKNGCQLNSMTFDQMTGCSYGDEKDIDGVKHYYCGNPRTVMHTGWFNRHDPCYEDLPHFCPLYVSDETLKYFKEMKDAFKELNVDRDNFWK